MNQNLKDLLEMIEASEEKAGHIALYKALGWIGWEVKKDPQTYTSSEVMTLLEAIAKSQKRIEEKEISKND